jgi:hypothetical protein
MLRSFALIAFTSALAAAGAANAQAPTPAGPGQNQNQNLRQEAEELPDSDARTTGTGATVRGQRRAAPSRREAPAGPTAEEIRAAVTPLAAAVAPACQITESTLLGAREDGSKLYEVACASGPGYVIEAAAAGPKSYDCVLQWSYAQQARERDPAADVGQQCVLPGNQNPLGVIAAYGREAGLDCQVDQAVATAVGVYEIGCAGRDGWRLEKADAGWTATTCWQFALVSDTACRYSTPDESRAEWPKLVAGTDAAACQIQDVAWMGDNPARGSFYELKCASGEGIIVRFKDGAGQQTYSCVDAPQVFRKPCSLTTVEAPAAAPQPAGGRA